MDENRLKLITLAALLHDIGKFGQRAGSGASVELEQELLPFRNGYFSHRHALQTDYFIERELPLPPELEPMRSVLARMSAAHHKPAGDSLEEICLRDADWASSGHDRVDGQSGTANYKDARLECIFNSVALRTPRGLRAEEAPRIRLAPIDDGSAIFPVTQAEAQASSYAGLWNGFMADIRALPLDMGISHWMHSLQSVLERWTWCIPSATNKKSDISLYDHCHSTAALAQALYAKRSSGEAGDEFLLFGGEISGIQKYIFCSGEKAGKGAGRLLRARSFMLQMITRSFWMALLKRCGLLDAARIMDAGGRFILLLPNIQSVREAVAWLEKEAQRWLLARYHGVVRAQFACMALPREHMKIKGEGGAFQERFNEFNDLLDKAKLRPYAALMRGGLPARLLDPSAYGEYGECSVCGFRPAAAKHDDRAECAECSALMRLGRELPEAGFALIGSSAGPGVELFGGLSLRLFREEPSPREAAAADDILNFRGRTRFTAQPVAGYVPRVSPEEIDAWKKEGRFTENGSLVCDGEEITPGAAKTFAMLARLGQEKADGSWQGLPALAVCKADVDNLGLLFNIGFGTGEESLLSISRFASLSRMVHHFFSSWLVRMAEKEFPNIYVVFAGGDDLFVIGPWAEATRFALEARRAFTRFAGKNSEVTLSAGLPLAKPGLPIHAMRGMAEEMLEKSKNHPGGSKDAVTMFNTTVKWDEFTAWLEDGKRLERMLLDGKITQGAVRRILGYAREKRDFEHGDIAKGLYLSHMSYDLSRNWDAKKVSEKERAWLDALPVMNNFSNAELGVSWALYRTRRY